MWFSSFAFVRTGAIWLNYWGFDIENNGKFLTHRNQVVRNIWGGYTHVTPEEEHCWEQGTDWRSYNGGDLSLQNWLTDWRWVSSYPGGSLHTRITCWLQSEKPAVSTHIQIHTSTPISTHTDTQKHHTHTYIDTHTNTHPETHIHRNTHRHTDTHACAHTHIPYQKIHISCKENMVLSYEKNYYDVCKT